MSRTDDDAAARARLERIAWGAGSTPADAARARIALADLDREARKRPATAGVPATGSRRGRRSGAASVPESAVPVEVAEPEGPAQPVEHLVPVELLMPVEPAEPAHGAPDSRPDPVSDGGVEDGGVEDGDVEDGDRTPEVRPNGGRGTDLLAGGRRVLGRARVLLTRVRHTDRTVLWALGGAAVVIGLVAGTGVGLSIGTRSTAEPATAVTTPAVGTVTLEQMLDLPQTYADQLPGGIDAPVTLHTTRLVFTNRSLAGDDSSTPWNVWAGVGRDRSTLCLVATADRLQGTSACYPRDVALHGVVSLSDTSSSGTLWLRIVGGAVRGTVTSSPPPLY